MTQFHSLFTLPSYYAIVFLFYFILMFNDNCFSYCAMALCIGSVNWLSRMKQQSINQSIANTNIYVKDKKVITDCMQQAFSIVDNLVRGYPKTSSSPQQRFSTMRVSGKPLMDLWPGFADILSMFIANTDLWIGFCDTVWPNLAFSCC